VLALDIYISGQVDTLSKTFKLFYTCLSRLRLIYHLKLRAHNNYMSPRNEIIF